MGPIDDYFDKGSTVAQDEVNNTEACTEDARGAVDQVSVSVEDTALLVVDAAPDFTPLFPVKSVPDPSLVSPPLCGLPILDLNGLCK